jgi:hypothetical protein
MSEAEHTPGPWHLQPTSEGGFSIEKDGAGHAGGVLVLCSRNPHLRLPEESAANGRLISAAPELLYVAEELGAWFGLTKPPLDQWEELAEEFHKETGFMRPGKDYPMGAGLDEEREAERNATWKAWAEKRRTEMIARLRAAIRKATGQ